MPTSDAMGIAERLANHRTLGVAPPDERAWLVAHGFAHRFERGDVVIRKGEMPPEFEALWVLFEGHFAIFVDRGAGPKKVMEWRGGDVSGLLPYSRTTVSIGEAIALEPTEILLVHRRLFPQLTRECPAMTEILVHAMLDRARSFTSSDLHDEKMLSLGKLAAGLAHELNNPASAATRASELLEQGLDDLAEASRALGNAGFSTSQLAMLETFRDTCTVARHSAVPAVLSPIERADREDAIADWLEAREADTATAAALAEAGITIPRLDALATSFTALALPTALHWIAAEVAARTLLSDLKKSSARIYDLVASVKRFTHMDRVAPEEVDVAQGIRDTAAVLRSRVRERGVELTLDIALDLPHTRGYAGELNQVWANLVDNAVDAAGSGGHVAVSAQRELKTVVVRVVDSGPGVPPEIRDKIFDPFFTTKPVGQGTGLGLDIVQRLVRRHGGDIDLDSRVSGGRTEFRITLPAV